MQDVFLCEKYTFFFFFMLQFEQFCDIFNKTVQMKDCDFREIIDFSRLFSRLLTI